MSICCFCCKEKHSWAARGFGIILTTSTTTAPSSLQAAVQFHSLPSLHEYRMHLYMCVCPYVYFAAIYMLYLLLQVIPWQAPVRVAGIPTTKFRSSRARPLKGTPWNCSLRISGCRAWGSGFTPISVHMGSSPN